MVTSLRNHIGLAILRVAASTMMLSHGIPKFQKLLAGDFKFDDPLDIGETPSLFLTVIGEFVCPILIIIGFKTRWAAIPTIITMIVAAFIVHAKDAFATKEHALMYAVFFLCIALLGPGKYSIDTK